MSVRPPALKAVFAGCFSWHKFDAFRRGGIFAQWGTGPVRSIEDDMRITPVMGDGDKVQLRKAAEEHQLSTPLLSLWQSLPFRDSWSPLVGSRFWSEGSAASYQDSIQRSGIALYVAAGWQDELRDQGLITFLNVPDSRVVVGPWKHCFSGDFPLLQEMHRFFDYHLKGFDTGLANDARIHYFTMTGKKSGQWQESNEWPLPTTKNKSLFLSDKELTATNKKSHSQTLFPKPEKNCTPKWWGPFSQPCSRHAASVTYTAQALDQAVTVTGHPVIDIWISSTLEDANIFAYLEDIAPNGDVTVVTEGRLKASLRKEAQAPWKMPAGLPWHRAYAEDSQPLKPGEIVNLRFDLLPTSWVFKPGHRIQLSITGSDYRERLREPASVEEKITVYSGRKHPSKIYLPQFVVR